MIATHHSPPTSRRMRSFSDQVSSFCQAYGCDRPLELLAADMVKLRQAIDLLELKFSQLAAEIDASDAYEHWGSTTSIDWVRHQCKMGGGAAADRIEVGQCLEQMPASVAALAAGEIGFSHLTLIARTATALCDSPTSKGFDETKLLEQAKECSVGRFRHHCQHARHAQDPEGYVAEENRLVEQRSLWMNPQADGSLTFSGLLDPEGGALLQTALEPLAKPLSRDDDRRQERRLADALVELAQHSLDQGLVPQHASQRSHLQVTTTLETLLQQAGAPAADLEFSLPISAKAVERLACDCTVHRILLGSDSAVIDVGRAKRVISGPLRRALNARDRGCSWPGCNRPACRTNGHHLRHWIHGGQTNLDNLCLLCYHHHRKVHEGGWQLIKTDDGRILTVPPQPDG